MFAVLFCLSFLCPEGVQNCHISLGKRWRMQKIPRAWRSCFGGENWWCHRWNPKRPPGMYKTLANIGINYQPQLVGRISATNSRISDFRSTTSVRRFEMFQIYPASWGVCVGFVQHSIGETRSETFEEVTEGYDPMVKGTSNEGIKKFIM